ncbi:MAG: hypothetical protein N2V75_08520, partial [Methanophagales archaeon]|nr:hypothetical protein [Methanophagales archaeon]
VDANEQLLSTGVWGLVTLRYSEPLRDERGRDLTLRVMIGDFKPFHVSNTDLKGFIKKRQISLSMNGLTC